MYPHEQRLNADDLIGLKDGIACRIVRVADISTIDCVYRRAVKLRGAMVGDREVVGILLRKLLEPEQQNGALLDGFPRTKVQKRVPQAALEG